MNKKIRNVLKWLVITVIILVIGFFYSFNEETKTYAITPESVECYNEQNVIYSFECKHNNLVGVEVLLGNESDAVGEISYVLQDEKGNNVTKVNTKKLSSLDTDKYTEIKTELIRESKDKIYNIVVSCDNDKQNSVAISGGSNIKYSYIMWDVETMIVFCLGAFYLVGLSKILAFMFKK